MSFEDNSRSCLCHLSCASRQRVIKRKANLRKPVADSYLFGEFCEPWKTSISRFVEISGPQSIPPAGKQPRQAEMVAEDTDQEEEDSVQGSISRGQSTEEPLSESPLLLAPPEPRAPLHFWDHTFARWQPLPVCSVNTYRGPAPCPGALNTCSWP